VTELGSLERFLLKNESCCELVGRSPVSGEYCLVGVAPGTKGFVSFAFLKGARAGEGVKIGSEHEEDVYRDMWPSQRSMEFKEGVSI